MEKKSEGDGSVLCRGKKCKILGIEMTRETRSEKEIDFTENKTSQVQKMQLREEEACVKDLEGDRGYFYPIE